MDTQEKAPPVSAGRGIKNVHFRCKADYTTTTDYLREFSQAVERDTGAIVEVIDDSQIHRFDDPEGKRHNRACWYLLHGDGLPAGAYGNWRTGFQATWSAKGRDDLSPAERERINRAVEVAREQRAQERRAAQAEAQHRAKKLWEPASPATVDHPYIARKRVFALGLRESGGMLLVPLIDSTGTLINLQTIDGNGNKRFLGGGRITGCFCLVGASVGSVNNAVQKRKSSETEQEEEPSLPREGRLYICEGWATAATIHAESRRPVAAAMNAGNIKPVALELHRAFPELELIVAADNDHRTPGNPGIAKGTDAARAIGGGMIWPRPCRDECTCTDFNDLAQCGEVSA